MPATNLLDSNSCRSTAYAKDLRGSLILSPRVYIHSTIDRGFRSPLDSCCDIRSFPWPPHSYPSRVLSFDPSFLLPTTLILLPSPLLLLLLAATTRCLCRTKHFLIGFRSERTVRPISFRKGSGCFCRFYRISMWLLSFNPVLLPSLQKIYLFPLIHREVIFDPSILYRNKNKN